MIWLRTGISVSNGCGFGFAPPYHRHSPRSITGTCGFLPSFLRYGRAVTDPIRPEDSLSPNAALLGTAVSIAPAALGCAVGLLLADRMKRETRHSLASTLLAVGVLSATPLAVDYINRVLNSPARRRGSRRRLAGIRSNGVNLEADILGGEEYFIDEM